MNPSASEIVLSPLTRRWFGGCDPFKGHCSIAERGNLNCQLLGQALRFEQLARGISIVLPDVRGSRLARTVF